MNTTIKELAEMNGAKMAEPLCGNELVSFKVLRSGNIEVGVADGSTMTVASRSNAGDGPLPPDFITAERFLEVVGKYAALPVGASPEGRKFIRRAALDPAGRPCMRFSE